VFCPLTKGVRSFLFVSVRCQWKHNTYCDGGHHERGHPATSLSLETGVRSFSPQPKEITMSLRTHDTSQNRLEEWTCLAFASGWTTFVGAVLLSVGM